MAAAPSKAKKNIALNLAEDLHKNHTHAELIAKSNPKEIVYPESAVISILLKYGLPAPDFEGYAKVAKNLPEGYMNNKRELLNVSAIIKKGMEKKKLTNKGLAEIMNLPPTQITRILSGANMTIKTMLKLERVLDIKLLNH